MCYQSRKEYNLLFSLYLKGSPPPLSWFFHVRHTLNLMLAYPAGLLCVGERKAKVVQNCGVVKECTETD